jgi:uncharacterized membrane protein (UPF0127 family)
MNFNPKAGLPLTGIFLCFFFITASFAGCAPKKLAVREILIERNGTALTAVKAEIARTQDERSRGLMFRKHVGEGEGMFFVFERDEVLSFWMKNTVIPLSLAFIASDGRIVEIRDLRPNDLNTVKSSRSVRYALEVPQGWFSRAGVQPGDVVQFGQ